MASTINASNSTTSGLIYSADNSGTLQLQTNGNAALTIDTNQNISFAKAFTANSATIATLANSATIATLANSATIATLANSATIATTANTLSANATMTNPIVTNYTETTYTANTGSAITISLSNGTVQNLVCNTSTTITLPSSVAGKSFIIILNYTGTNTVAWTGGGTLKWPANTAPTATSTSGKYDIFTFFQDGTNTYGQTFGLNY